MLPTRFEVDGVRHYRTGDNPDRSYPSATAILSKTAGAKANQTLAQWNLRNPGAREEAALRGSTIHLACENYIRGKPVELPEKYQPYWDGLAPHLDRYDYFIWSEKPLRPEWDFCVGADGISRVWSHKYKYCGCPDLVGVRGSTILVSDFKSSVGPYSRYYPKHIDRSRFGGWSKFNKCTLQLGGYSLALEETLGIPIHMAQILVTTPETVQQFILQPHELKQAQYRWLQRVASYYKIKELENEVAALEPEALAVA